MLGQISLPRSIELGYHKGVLVEHFVKRGTSRSDHVVSGTCMFKGYSQEQQ